MLRVSVEELPLVVAFNNTLISGPEVAARVFPQTNDVGRSYIIPVNMFLGLRVLRPRRAVSRGLSVDMRRHRPRRRRDSQVVA